MSSKFNIANIIESEQELFHQKKHGVSLWDPRVKLALLTVAITLNIGIANTYISSALLIIGFMLVLWTRPPMFRTTLFYLAPLVPTLIAVVGISMGFGITPLVTIGKVSIYKEGIFQGLGVLLRVYCDITWLVLTFVTTQFTDILKALHWYKIPGILVDTLAMMYRYCFLLYEEFSKMYVAAYSRGGMKGKINAIRTVSRIGAQIFIRAYDRSERIYTAKYARGGE